MFSVSDVLRAVLRRRQPLQATADLHGEDHGEVQGHQETRGSAARVRHHRHSLPVHAAR